MTRPDRNNNSNNDDGNATDPLFQRFNIEEEITFDHQEELRTNSSKELPAQVLEAVGDILDHADHTLEELSSNDLLGSAIVRSCGGLADAVGQLASELEKQSEEDRRALATACLEDVQKQQQALQSSSQQQQQQQQQQQSSQAIQEFSQMTPEDIMSALSGCSTLLRDVEAGLRGIEQDEADEIADVALTLARLFVTSLQSFHSSVVHKEEQKRQLEASRVEILDDEHEPNKNENKDARKTSAAQRQRRMNQRLRVLWPPIGPAVQNACQWGKDEAINKPILAVALGITLWPAAVVTAFFGAPVVLADSLLQHTYNTFQNGPIIGNLEQGAAQVYQTGKLSLLTGKLVGRQSLRVLNRQIERNGGIGAMAQNLAGMAVDRALHPAETAGAIWGGLNWGFGMVQDTIQGFNDPDRRDAAEAMWDDIHSLR